MTIEELCEAVNAALADAGVDVTDGRTTTTVTPRNVRYYRSVGLIAAPSRVGGRSSYTEEHLREIVAIKTAQAEGTSLETLKLRRQKMAPMQWEPSDLAMLSRVAMPSLELRPSLMAFQTVVTTPKDEYPEDVMPGWSFEIRSRNHGRVMVSGTGRPPSHETLRHLQELLDPNEVTED